MMLQQSINTLYIDTPGRGLFEITADVQSFVRKSTITDGLLTAFISHTSASLTIQENADPDVKSDLVDAVDRLAPMDNSLYRHTAEGPDDMPAHIKSALTDVSLSIPVMGYRMTLGTWQGIYVFEHRISPQNRRISLHIIGT